VEEIQVTRQPARLEHNAHGDAAGDVALAAGTPAIR
jgi:hypothetical protein